MLLVPKAPSLVVKCLPCGGVVGMNCVRSQLLWEAYIKWLLFTALVPSRAEYCTPIQRGAKETHRLFLLLDS